MISSRDKYKVIATMLREERIVLWIEYDAKGILDGVAWFRSLRIKLITHIYLEEILW